MKSIFEPMDLDYIQIATGTVLGLGDKGCRPGLLAEEFGTANISYSADK